MGDLIEITTVSKQQSIFYKITSGSFTFQVKGPGNAGIGLSRKPSRHCQFWIVIGCQGSTWITKGGKQVQSIRTPSILSPVEFRGFWVQWHYDMLCIGREHSTEPFLTCRDKTFDVKYVTLAVVGDSASALQWKMEMPPLQEPLKLKQVSGGSPQWKLADTQLPDGALIGGYEKELLYIIRASHRGSLTPGKFVPSLGLGFIPWGGASHEKSDFEVLCGYDCTWMPCSNGRIPTGAVPAGYSESEDHEQLFVGRAMYNDHLIPGKVQPSHRTCYIPYDNREIALKSYEILVIPHKNIHSGNPYFMYDIGINETPVHVVNVEEFDDGEIDMERDFH
ncbi:uncharacterized protein [Epargyreus clarus]|uniref:uncharacterized protein n=1 Tax=Epargyreus clarus TaxID=520877 RepID=UPI003C2EFF23